MCKVFRLRTENEQSQSAFCGSKWTFSGWNGPRFVGDEVGFATVMTDLLLIREQMHIFWMRLSAFSSLLLMMLVATKFLLEAIRKSEFKMAAVETWVEISELWDSIENRTATLTFFTMPNSFVAIPALPMLADYRNYRWRPPNWKWK